MVIEEEGFKLTVTSLQSDAGCDAVYDHEDHNVTPIILNKTFELLDFLLHWIPYVLLAPRLHIDIWSGGDQPENIQIHEIFLGGI